MSDLKRKKIEFGLDLEARYKPFKVQAIFKTDNDEPEELYLPIEKLYKFSEAEDKSSMRRPFEGVRNRYGIPVSLKEKTWWRYHLASLALSEIHGKNYSISSALNEYFYKSIIGSLTNYPTNAVKDEIQAEFDLESLSLKEKLKILILTKDKNGNEEGWETNIADLTFHLIPIFRTLLLILIKPEYAKIDDSVISEIEATLYECLDENSRKELEKLINNWETVQRDQILRDIILNSKINFSELWKNSKKISAEIEINKNPTTLYEMILKEKKRSLEQISSLTKEALLAYEERFLMLKEISQKSGKFKIS